VKHLDDAPDDEIPDLNIPTRLLLRYELDEDLKELSSNYRGEPEAAACVANEAG
jgi:2,3-bisphosphoglycerate-dependent phosphoglycerate mutase